MFDYALVGVAGFFMSVVSSISGGGAGLVMTPLMLLLGFPPQTVLASSKAGGLGLNVGALSKFIRQEGYINWRLGSLLAVLAVGASFAGTRLVFVLSATALRHLVAIITLALVPVLLFQRKIGLRSVKVSNKRQSLGVFAYFIIMAAQAGLGSGIGILLMYVLMGLMGFDALHANATKRLAGFILITTSFIIFAFSGYINWVLAACLAAGMLSGGYLGAHMAVKGGNRLVKNALLAVTAIMGIAVLFTR